MLPRSILALSCACTASAAAAAPRNDPQLWTSVGASGDIAGPVHASVEAIERFGDAAGGLYEIELSALLGLKLGKVDLEGGYVHNPGYDHGTPTELEHRMREQITLDAGKLGGGKLAFRLRGEQRWVDGVAGTAVRVRPWVRWTLPLGTRGATVALSHESFVNLDTVAWGPQAGYDRMRNAVVAELPLSKAVRFEGGYLNQFTLGRGGEADEVDHVLTLGLAFAW